MNEKNIILNHIKKFTFMEILTDVIFILSKMFILTGSLLILWVILDNLIHLSDEWRIIFFIFILIFFIYFIFVLFKSTAKTYNDSLLPLRLEKYNNHLQNWLVNSVCFCKLENLKENSIENEIIKITSEKISLFSLYKRLNFKSVIKNTYIPLILFALVLIYTSLCPQYFINAFKRLLIPFSDLSPITRTSVNPLPKSAEVYFGDDYEIKFNAFNYDEETANISYSKEGIRKTFEEIVLMDQSKNFQYKFENIRSNITYSVNLGDFRSKKYLLKVIMPPKLLKQRVIIDFPQYLSKNTVIIDKNIDDFDIINGSELNFEFEFDKSISGLCFVDLNTNTEMTFNGNAEGLWKLNYKFEDSQRLQLKYYLNAKSAFMEKIFKLNAVEDNLPNIIMNNEKNIIIYPDNDMFKIDIDVTDDFGLKEYKLLSKYQNQEKWNIIDEKNPGKIKQLKKEWILDFKQLSLSDNNSVDFRVDIYDINPNRKEPVSETLNVRKISYFENNINLYKMLVEGNLLNKKYISELLFMGEKNNLGEEVRLIKENLENINKILVKLKLSKIADTSTYIAQQKTDSLKNNISEILKLNDFDEFNRFIKDYVDLWKMINSERLRMIHLILQNAMEEFKDLINSIKIETIEDWNVKQLTSKWKEIQNTILNLSIWIEKNHDVSLSKIIKQKAIILGKNDILQLCKEMENNIKNRKYILEIAEKIKVSLEKLSENLFYTQSDANPVNSDEVFNLMRIDISRLEKLHSILGRMNLKETSFINEVEIITVLIEKSIDLTASNISHLQAQFPAMKIKGLTLLNAAKYEIQELRSRYKNKEYLKSESKLKKARDNIFDCIVLLNNNFKIKEIKPEISDESAKINAMDKPFIGFINPDENLVVNKSSSIPIEGIAEFKKGVYQVWISFKILGSGNIIKISDEKLIGEYVDLPESVKFNYEIKMDEVNLTNDERLEITLKCLGDIPDNQIISESKALWIRLAEEDEFIDFSKYYGFKSMVARILKEILNTENKELKRVNEIILNVLKDSFKDELSNNVISLMQEQNIIYESFNDLLSQFEKYKLNNRIPEADFIKFMDYSKEAVLLNFNEINELIYQIVSLSKTAIDEAWIQLLINIKSKIEELNLRIEKLIDFFSSDVSKESNVYKNDSMEILNGNIRKSMDILKDILVSDSSEKYNALKTSLKDILEDCSKEFSTFTNNDLIKISKELQEVMPKIDVPYETKNNEELNNLSLVLIKIERILETIQKSDLGEKLKQSIELLQSNDAQFNDNIGKIKDISNQLKMLGADSAAGISEMTDMINSKDSAGEIEVLVNSCSSIWKEKELDIRDRSELMNKKLGIIHSKFLEINSSSALSEQQIAFFRKLILLYEIFLKQTENIKIEVKTVDDSELKDFVNSSIVLNQDWVAKIQALVTSISKKIEDSFFTFTQSKKEFVENNLSGLFKPEDISENINEIKGLSGKITDLVDRIKIFNSFSSKDNNENEKILNNIDVIIKEFSGIVNKTLKLCSDIYNSNNEIHIKFLESVLLYKVSLNENNFCISSELINKIKDLIPQTIKVLTDVNVRLMQDTFFNLKDYNVGEIEKKILRYSHDIKKIEDILSDINSKMNKTLKDEEEISSINKKIETLKNDIQQLNIRKTEILKGADITVELAKRTGIKLPLITKLELDNLKNETNDLKEFVNGANEKADNLIINNLMQELDEIETTSMDSDSENKRILELKNKYFMFGFVLTGDNAKKIKQDVEAKQNKNKDKIHAMKLSEVLQNLNTASMPISNEPGKTMELKEERLRYLDAMSNKLNAFSTIKKDFKSSYILSKKFDEVTKTIMDKCTEELNELRQNIDSEQFWKEKINIAEETISKVNMTFKKESRVIFNDSKNISNKIKLDYEYDAVELIPGYEEITREYMISIAEK